MTVTGSEELHAMVADAGNPGAKMFRPLFPLKLNLMGMDWPALTSLTTGKLLIGLKKPVNL